MEYSIFRFTGTLQTSNLSNGVYDIPVYRNSSNLKPYKWSMRHSGLPELFKPQTFQMEYATFRFTGTLQTLHAVRGLVPCTGVHVPELKRLNDD
jgi:hypothetical protein